MPTATSATRWRSTPLIPKDYEDVTSLIKLARESRHAIVEFDWVFTRDDLRHLRRGVYEWGIGVRGRYKCFDARMLSAINQALGEKDSTLVLNEPKNSQSADCKVSCVRKGKVFRLFGHAPFDIMFGYGRAGVDLDVTGSAHLGPTVQKTLGDAVGMLNWDLIRLQEERYWPVRNALYGLQVTYGMKNTEPNPGPAMDLQVDFHGPFSALDEGGVRCLFVEEIAKRSGIYLWTIHVEGERRLWYVGQTRRGFGQRMGEHIACFLTGQYTSFDSKALSKGEYRRAAGSVTGMWPQSLSSLLQNYETLMPQVASLIRLIEFHVAPLVSDAHLLNLVEGAIGRHYKGHSDPELRDFFWPGIKLPPVVLQDKAIRLVISSEATLAGLPPTLPA